MKLYFSLQLLFYEQKLSISDCPYEQIFPAIYQIKMNRKIHFCSIALFLASVSTLSPQTLKMDSQNPTDLSVNVYNQPLKPCGNETMKTGSWDPEYKCSEPNGGVHQICIERIAETTNKFSLNTGQTDWSTGRGSENHCVCLGAWSMYVARKNKKEITDGGQRQLKCDAIPRIALTKNYVKKFQKKDSYQGWEKWNGLELENQIVDGVNQLFRQCSQSANEIQLQGLKSNYCSFAKGIEALQSSKDYLTNCPQAHSL